MRAIVAIVAATSTFAAACAGSHETPSDGVSETRAPEPAAADTVALEPEPIRFEAPVRIETPRREVIREASTWSALWREATTGVEPPPGPPRVDFGARSVLLAAAGRKPTGGYGVAIESARLVGDTLHVDVVERAPGEACMTTQAITYPVAAATIDRVGGEAVFHVREERRDC